MVYRGFYPRLLEALERSGPGIAQDDPAEVARRYPQSGVPDDWHSEAQTRFPPPVDVPSREERRLSLARFAAEVLASGGEPAQAAGYAGPYGAGLGLPSWARTVPSISPMRGGRFGLAWPGGAGGPLPPPSPSDRASIRMREIPELPQAWKLLWPLIQASPEYLRKRLLGELYDSKDADAAVGPILEFDQKRGQRDGSETPKNIPDAPSIVPDAQGDASATTDKHSGGPRKDDADCEKERQEARAFCLEAREQGLKGFFGIEHLKKPRSTHWDIDKCMKGQMSGPCGGNPIDSPGGKLKKRK